MGINDNVKRTTTALVLILTAIAGTISGLVVTTLNSDRIAAGVTVAGMPVGGLTQAEARQRLSPLIRQVRERPLILQVGDSDVRITLRQLRMSPNPQATVEKAYEIGRKGNWLQRFIVLYFPDAGEKRLGVSIAFDLERLDRVLEGICRPFERKHKDAKLRIVAGAFVIEREQPGIKVDVGRCAQDIIANAWRGKPIRLALVEDTPDVMADDLRSIDTSLSSFTTRFSTWKRNRTFNIHLAVKSLDGALTKPGEVFSFNKAVGPRLKKLGYREAPVFVNGELEPGTGGGVCQLSTTVYNAALLANMKIIRRSHHSGKVAYAPLGRDATVAYGAVDLKFRNTGSVPIYIAAVINRSRLTVTLYGSAADKSRTQIVSGAVKRLPHGTVFYTDRSLKPGVRVVKRPGQIGYEVSTYRIVTETGGKVKKERVSFDRYKPLHTKIAVGPPDTEHSSTEQLSSAQEAN